MNEDMHETEEWEDLIAEVDAEVAAEGGSTGSNMAETYIPPNVKEILKDVPAEELAKTDAELDVRLAK